MKKIAILLLFTMTSHAQRLVDYVNPMVGTQSMGHTYPGVAAPFGLVALSPDTNMVPQSIDGVYQPDAYKYCAGYQYADSTIVGFSHTHFNGTGHSDLGDILLMPTVGEPSVEMADYRSAFSHEREHASVGHYRVVLDDDNITAELTATERTGVHRYTYPADAATGNVIIDLDYGIYNYDGKTIMANLYVQDAYTLTGYRITRGWSRMNYTHFAIKFSKPILQYGCRDAEKPHYNGFWRKFDMTHGFPEMFGTKLAAWFTFDNSDGKSLEVRVALSPVDMAGALRNLEAETTGKSFDEIVAETQAKWERELSVVEVETATEERRRIFYTALYRTMLNPSVYQDIDGRYRGIDHNIHTAANGRTNYTVFSVWDTFRAEHPLMNLLKPRFSEQFVASMLDHYRQSVHGALPVWSHMGNENWCMMGFHSVSVLADAVAKGIPVDRRLALEAALSSANVPYYDQLAQYRKLNYVPSDLSAVSASATLEYAYDDWALSTLATGSTAELYRERAQNYCNVFDPTIRFARPRNAAGVFKPDFDPLQTHDMGFIEGNSWNYSFFVPHDVKGLIARMGGERRFIGRLDSLFTMPLPAEYYAHTEDITEEGLMGNYVHGNEPSHHVAYLYAWTSEPWRGQARLHQIMSRMYKDKPDGLCGNDDCGQMSAWFVFSSLGFYPVCPGSDQYIIGSPFVDRAVLNLENGRKFVVRAKGLSDKNVYVKSVSLNGKPLRRRYITHAEIVAGGELLFEMAAQPETAIAYVDNGSHLIEEGEEWVREHIEDVINALYFSTDDPNIPRVNKITIVADPAFTANPAQKEDDPAVSNGYIIRLSPAHFEKFPASEKRALELAGVMNHELVHVYQTMPHGAGSYDGRSPYWAFIEGTADAVRPLLAPYADGDTGSAKPTGTYLSGYRTTGWFLLWLLRKDPDFLRKFNATGLTISPWSWDAAMQTIFGDGTTTQALWDEYQQSFQ